MDPVDAASRRTIRFVCRSHTTTREVSDDDSPSASIVESKKIVKRQRTVQTSVVNVRLVEFIRNIDEANGEHDKHYGLFVWPSALLLCRFIASETEWLCRDKVVLELGCGTGLPSILAALCGARKVYLTDRPDAADIKRNAEANINVNNIQSCAEFIPLSWGDMHVSDEMLSIFHTAQVVLAADCFYQSEGCLDNPLYLNFTVQTIIDALWLCRSADFEKLLATVALIIRCSGSASCKFYCTYQLRSIKRSIASLLARWGFTATCIDKGKFLSDEDDGSVQDLDSVYLYEIAARR